LQHDFLDCVLKDLLLVRRLLHAGIVKCERASLRPGGEASGWVRWAGWRCGLGDHARALARAGMRVEEEKQVSKVGYADVFALCGSAVRRASHWTGGRFQPQQSDLLSKLIGQHHLHIPIILKSRSTLNKCYRLTCWWKSISISEPALKRSQRIKSSNLQNNT
jgi:hypothetical protein